MKEVKYCPIIKMLGQATNSIDFYRQIVSIERCQDQYKSI